MAATRIALAQIDTRVGDLDGNARKVLDQARRAAEAGADVVVLGEMTLAGYPIEDLALRGSFQRAAAERATRLATELDAAGLGGLAVVVGTLGTVGGPHPGSTAPRPSNRALVLRGGRVEASYDKRHLPNYGVFDEYRIFAPGSTTTVFEAAGRRFGLVVCEDVWVDGPVSELAGVDAILVLNGSPFEAGKSAVRRELVARRAREAGAPVCYVNLVGGQDDLVFDGASFAVAADGELVARAPAFVEHLLLVDLPEDGPPRGEIAPEPGLEASIYRACVAGLAGYASKNGFRSVALGLSGGIDSALVAAMAADALGGENVVGVAMPSRFSSQHSLDDAEDLARRIGADYRVVPIDPMVTAFESQLPLEGVAAENIQARVRGMILMSLSNLEGHLVLATGNKSELAVGYSTIYGDAVGGYAPIKDVDKSRVWALARWRNELALEAGEIPPIPESSITKPPSAELSPGQRDSDSLPPYDVLDEVLAAYVEHAEGRAELLARGFDPAVVEQVVRLVDRAEWKRRQYPLGPKVSALAFGRDRRLPVTSAWREPDTEEQER